MSAPAPPRSPPSEPIFARRSSRAATRMRPARAALTRCSTSAASSRPVLPRDPRLFAAIRRPSPRSPCRPAWRRSPDCDPSPLDACFQTLGATFSGGGECGAFLPLADRSATFHGRVRPAWARARVQSAAPRAATWRPGDIVPVRRSRRVSRRSTASPSARRAGAPGHRPIAGPTGRLGSRAALPAPAAIGAAALAGRSAPSPRPKPPRPRRFGEALEQLAAAYASARSQGRAEGDARRSRCSRISDDGRRPPLPAPTRTLWPRASPLALASAGDRPSRAQRPGAAGCADRRADPLSCCSAMSTAAARASMPIRRSRGAERHGASPRSRRSRCPAGRPRAPRARDRRRHRRGVRGAEQAVAADKLALPSPISRPPSSRPPRPLRPGLARFATLDIEHAPGRRASPAAPTTRGRRQRPARDQRPRASLRHAARPAGAGGILLLLEAARHSNWSDLVFGLTAGWWRFADSDLRANHPLLSGERWQPLLRGAFAAAEIVAIAGRRRAGPGDRAGAEAERGRSVWEPPREPRAARARQCRRRGRVQQALAKPNPPALRLVRAARACSGERGQRPPTPWCWAWPRPALEHPELDCRLIDLTSDADPARRDGAADSGEIAWRDGARLRPRLARAPLAADKAFRTTGTHLITGGLGGLGLAARDVAARARRRAHRPDGTHGQAWRHPAGRRRGHPGRFANAPT